MTHAGQALVWPDGSTYTITRSSTETGGELLEMEWALPANAWAPPPHVHPHLTEEYEVLEGSLDVLTGTSWRTLTAGARASIMPGTVHTFRASTGPVRVRNVHRPALDFEPYIRRLCEVANRHNLGDLAGWPAIVHVAVLLHEFPQHSRPAGRATQAAVAVVAALGRLAGAGTETDRDRAVPDAGDVIENPVTGQRLTFSATARDTAGEVFRAEGAFPPGGFAGVEHVHPRQDEHFEVLAGRAAFRVEGREVVLGAGETIDVPAGTRHTFANGGDEEMRVLFEFRPALECTDLFYELYFGAAQEGRVNAQAMPGLLDIAIAWPLVSEHAVLARPPAWVQHLTFWLLRPVARLMRRELPACERIRGA